ncbi:MAG TPA: hypothetical protein PKY12_02070, partial [Catalimonadaceae bacterium]|nr:hypothetical protein [Catalimonadaceae bacterium]
MTINKKAVRVGYIISDFVAAVCGWLLFFWYRIHITGDLKTGKFFSLLNSSIAIGLFWCLLYGFWGFYKDYLRKSRIKEAY